jgi:predicted XRE-type DNA-binding protein
MTDLELMQALRNDGMTLQRIADKFEVSKDYVSYHTKKPYNLMTMTALKTMLAGGNLPEYEVKITHKGEVVGVYTPI